MSTRFRERVGTEREADGVGARGKADRIIDQHPRVTVARRAVGGFEDGAWVTASDASEQLLGGAPVTLATSTPSRSSVVGTSVVKSTTRVDSPSGSIRSSTSSAEAVSEESLMIPEKSTAPLSVDVWSPLTSSLLAPETLEELTVSAKRGGSTTFNNWSGALAVDTARSDATALVRLGAAAAFDTPTGIPPASSAAVPASSKRFPGTCRKPRS